MFRPRSAAVVGASTNPSFVSGILRNLLRYGYQGPVAAVNPRYESVLGAPCYPSIVEVPDPLDLVMIGVANTHLPGILEQCERKRVGALDIVSSGFSEMAGDAGVERQAELAAWATRTGIPVGGPNCLGLLNAHTGLNALYSGFERIVPGVVGCVMQSGQMATALLGPMFARDIGVTISVTSGNEADLEAADYISYLAEDDETRVIACFTEQIKTPAKFVAACELAAKRRKPIVMLKIGRSAAAESIARAHTGSLVGSDVVVDAVLRKLGVTRVNSIDELVEAIAIFHARELPRGGGVCGVFVSGGAVGMYSDLAADHGVSFPSLPDETVARLNKLVPEFGSVGNPLDITGQGVFDSDLLNGSLEALAESGVLDIIFYGRGYPSRLDRQSLVGRALKGMVERYPDILFLVTSIAGGDLYASQSIDMPVAEPMLELDGMPFLQGAEYSLKAIASLIRYAELQRRRAVSTKNAGRVSTPDAQGAESAKRTADRARTIIRAAKGRALTERESKGLLALYGIRTTRELLAASVEQALAAAERVGWPVALKVESPDLLHKTEAGALLLDVRDGQALAAGYERVLANARRAAPGAELRGVLVQEMVEPGVEMFVGLKHDPQFGPVLACGLGGVLVETLKDVQILLPPLAAPEARAALERLRGWPILQGVRGASSADVGALVDVLVRFAELATDLGDLVREIDVNPLVLFEAGRGACAVDALIVPAGV